MSSSKNQSNEEKINNIINVKLEALDIISESMRINDAAIEPRAKLSARRIDAVRKIIDLDINDDLVDILIGSLWGV